MSKKSKKAAVTEQVQVQVRITSKDDNISGTINLSVVHLITDYGTLELPVKNISGIRMGVTPLDNENGKPVDVIEIENNYTIGGQSNIKVIEVKTAYGNLSIPSEKIDRMDIYTMSEGQSVFKLLASKHISANLAGGWLNTGILLKKGKGFTITASGQVIFASLSGAKYSTDGTSPGVNAPNAGQTAQAVPETTFPSYGNVVYKIGEHGPMLRAGDKFSGTAVDSGVLYLSIYEAVYNPGNTGTYSVKVKRK